MIKSILLSLLCCSFFFLSCTKDPSSGLDSETVSAEDNAAAESIFNDG